MYPDLKMCANETSYMTSCRHWTVGQGEWDIPCLLEVNEGGCLKHSMSSAMISSSYALGIVFIVLVSIIWSAASVLTQHIYCDYGFDSPFLLTLLGSSLFVLWLPIYEIRQYLSIRNNSSNGDSYRYRIQSNEDVDSDASPMMMQSEISLHEIPSASIIEEEEEKHSVTLATNSVLEEQAHFKHIRQSFNQKIDCNHNDLKNGVTEERETFNEQELHFHRNSNEEQLTKYETFRIALVVAPLWLLSNVTYNLSLEWTSVSSSTILASTGSLFAFFFAVILRDENFSMNRLFGVLLFVLGSIVTGLNDASTSDEESTCGTTENSNDAKDASFRVWGDVASLMSAVGYGAYTVALRKLCPKNESLISLQLLFGYVGLINVILCGPVTLYLCMNGTINVPTGTFSWALVGLIFVKGFFDNVISDYLWARSVVLTSATVASVGVGLTIPLAFLSDIIIQRWQPTKQSVVGGVSVLIGFLIVNFNTETDNDDLTANSSDVKPGESNSQEITAENPVSYQQRFIGEHYSYDEHSETFADKSVII